MCHCGCVDHICSSWHGNILFISTYYFVLGLYRYLIAGLLTAVHQSQFRLLSYRELLFNDIADRVAQVLHVELCCDITQNTTFNILKEAIIVNTHLIFPHDSRYCFLRLQQVLLSVFSMKFLILVS